MVFSVLKGICVMDGWMDGGGGVYECYTVTVYIYICMAWIHQWLLDFVNSAGTFQTFVV